MDSRRSRNRRGEGGRLRSELVSAASTLLETISGEDALSLRAVARQAGVAPQSVYLHFADRRELMTAVYAVRFGELSAELASAAAAAGADRPCARLAAICHAYCDYALRHPGRYRVLFSTAGAPGWEPQAMPGMATWDLFRTAVRDCLGPAADDASADQAAVCIWAALHGLLTLRRDRPSFPWPDLTTLIDTVLAAHLHPRARRHHQTPNTTQTPDPP
jgi:AcrR family transcriptional regulator